MKNTLILLALITFGIASAQTNTFPTPSGNVGINTTTTLTEELEINGTTKTNQLIIGDEANVPSFINIWAEGSASMNHFINISGNTIDERLWVISAIGKDFRIITESDDFLTAKIGFVIRRGNGIDVSKVLFPEGNLGIGTENTDGWKLSVNGKIRAEEVKVQLESEWPDFVFSKNYDLTSLEEVEKHIQEKGHLKDIPSAKEVEEKGIKLGDMNSKLLQKIEELTLYVIEINKQVKDLKEENEKLKKLLNNKE